jgi:FixJ family two-component response regulator
MDGVPLDLRPITRAARKREYPVTVESLPIIQRRRTMTRQLIIVEDDASTRRSLTRWARVNGYEVFSFDCAIAFLAADVHVRECCLIVDVSLPDMSGGDLKRRIIADGRDLPTVFITAMNEDEAAAALLGLDAPHLLRKPFDSESLEAAIRAAA